MGQRRDGREAAVQFLFAAELRQVAGKLSDDENAAFWEIHTAKEGVRKFAEELAKGVLGDKARIDGHISSALTNFNIERLANVDRNILRLAVYEMLHTQSLPAPVIINEAIEIAKKYGAPESSGFVNGVLDRIGRELRPRAPKGVPAEDIAKAKEAEEKPLDD